MFGLAPVQSAFADTLTEVTVGYPKSPLNGPHIAGDDCKAGQRYRLAVEAAPAGRGTPPRFSLFSGSADTAKGLPAGLASLVEAKIQPDLEGRIYLVRPDGYLACSTRDLEEVATYLGRIAAH
jgi:hypothetical protein